MSQSRKRKTSFIGDVIKLVFGTTFAQIISILVSPLLTRLYTPEAFGLLALFASITGTIRVITCMRYEQSIILPKTDEEAADLLGVSLGFTFLISSLTVPIIWIGEEPLLRWLNAPQLAPYLWLVPPIVFIYGLFIALNYWNSRTKHFGRLSVAQMISSVATSGTKLAAGLTGYATGGSLIHANFFGETISTFILGGQIWRDDGHLFRSSITRSGMAAGIKRYYKFPLFNSWAAFLNTLSWQLPVMMLSAFYTPAVVGFYNLGNRVIRTPMMTIGNSMAKVFFQRAAEAHNAGQLDTVVRSVFERLVSYGLFPMLLITFIGEDLFTIVFGSDWAIAGVYTQILSVYMFFNFISSPLGQLFSVLEKQEVALLTNIALLVSRFMALWVGGKTGDVIYTLILFSLSGIIVYGGYSLWIMRSAGVPVQDWFAIVFRWTFICLAFISVSWLVSFSLDLSSWSLLLVYGISTVLYYLWLIARDEQVRQLVERTIRGRV